MRMPDCDADPFPVNVHCREGRSNEESFSAPVRGGIRGARNRHAVVGASQHGEQQHYHAPAPSPQAPQTSPQNQRPLAGASLPITVGVGPPCGAARSFPSTRVQTGLDDGRSSTGRLSCGWVMSSSCSSGAISRGPVWPRPNADSARSGCLAPSPRHHAAPTP